MSQILSQLPSTPSDTPLCSPGWRFLLLQQIINPILFECRYIPGGISLLCITVFTYLIFLLDYEDLEIWDYCLSINYHLSIYSNICTKHSGWLDTWVQICMINEWMYILSLKAHILTHRRNGFKITCYFSSKCSESLLLTEFAFICEGVPVVLMLLPLACSHHQQSLCLHFWSDDS